MLKNFIVTNHLGKNHKISDLFRHLKVGQIECRKRRILVGRVKLYISALQLENGELFYSSFLLSLMPMLFRIMHYAGKLKPYSVVSKDAGLILKIRA